MTKPKFSLDQPSPIIKNNSELPQDHQDMWKNIIDRYGNDYKPILKLMIERRQYGIDLYGTPLQVSNGRNAINDLISEHLDALVYSEIVRLENPEWNLLMVDHQKYLLKMIGYFWDIVHPKI